MRLTPPTRPYSGKDGSYDQPIATSVLEVIVGIHTIDVSPSLRDWQARCSAYRLDEQAVSRVKLGPRRSKNHDSRFAVIASLLPAAAMCGSSVISLVDSNS